MPNLILSQNAQYFLGALKYGEYGKKYSKTIKESNINKKILLIY